jgi:hypothetical protein
LKDANGNQVIDSATGAPKSTTSPVYLGSFQPKFMASWGTGLTIKGLSINVLFDTKQGGYLYSRTKDILEFVGVTPSTTLNDRQPFLWNNSVYENSNGDYVTNTNVLTDVYNYYTAANLKPAGQDLIKAGYVKLREVSIGYKLPQQWFSKTFIGSGSLSIYGNNLLIWTNKGNDYVDPEVNSVITDSSSAVVIESTGSKIGGLIGYVEGENPNKAIPKRLLKYGVDAERILCYDYVELNSNDKVPACYVIWESVDRKKFPNWKKASYAKLVKKADDVYELTCSNQDDKTETFTTLIRPKITIKSLFKFGPEKWDSNYAETLKEIQEQERTLAKMNDVKRTLTISQFGVYNCDRFYKNPEAFEAKVELVVPKGKNGFVPERYFYVSKRDKLSIDYAFSKKLLLFQDKTAALYTVLEGDVLAKVDTEQLLKCSKDDPTTQKLIFKPVTKINNTNELKDLMGI